jgi:hypothetical protein
LLNGPKKLIKGKTLRGKYIVVLPPDECKGKIIIKENYKNTIAIIGDWDQRVKNALINENNIIYKLMYKPKGKLNKKGNNSVIMTPILTRQHAKGV